MTSTTAGEIYYDPYDFDIDADPYPVWKRMRDESPLYYNEKYDFWALSRFDDVERCSIDWRTYRSGRGTVLEIIKQGAEIPPGSILFEDPPTHDVHRSLLSRIFTPRRIAELEPKVRAQNARTLGSSAAMRRGVNTRESSDRCTSWVGGSSNKIVPGGISMPLLIISSTEPRPEM